VPSCSSIGIEGNFGLPLLRLHWKKELEQRFFSNSTRKPPKLTLTFKLVRARDQTRLPREFVANPFSVSRDISYMHKQKKSQTAPTKTTLCSSLCVVIIPFLFHAVNGNLSSVSCPSIFIYHCTPWIPEHYRAGLSFGGRLIRRHGRKSRGDGGTRPPRICTEGDGNDVRPSPRIHHI